MLDLVDAGDPRGAILLRSLSRTLGEAVSILNRYYNAEIVVLTGGFVHAQLGSRFLREVNQQASEDGTSLPAIIISANPVFEGAVGAAKMAAARWKALTDIPGEARRLLREANAHRPPEVVAYGICAARQTIMNSVLGRDHYRNYNERFIRRYINHSTRDQVFGEAVAEKLIPEVSNLEHVGRLTPQQVQTAAVRAIAFATGRLDPFWVQKRLTNLTARNFVTPLSLWMEANRQIVISSENHFTATLKAFLAISALFNAFDFFNPEALGYGFRNVFGECVLSLSRSNFLEWLDKHIGDLLETQAESLIVHDEFQRFAGLLSRNPGGSILYFLDNAGEAVVDLHIAELMLDAGFDVMLVAGRSPFVDDVTVFEMQALVRQSETLLACKNSGRLKLASVESDMSVWDDVLLHEWQRAAGYIAKGMRKLSQLYPLNLRLSGLHVMLNKSDTIRRIIKNDRGISLTAEENGNVVFFFRKPRACRIG